MRYLKLSSLLVFLLFNCKSKNSKDFGRSKPIYYKVYRLNYIDEDSCKNCISSSFFNRIGLKTIINDKFLIFESSNEDEVDFLKNSFEKSKLKDLKRVDYDNTFVVCFYYENKKQQIFTYLYNGKWAIDTRVIEPKKNIFKIIKFHSGLNDLTDYENVSKGATPMENLK
jgi:hypothetical protein